MQNRLEKVDSFDIIRIQAGGHRMNDELKLMVNTIIDEMGRMEERINKKFDKIDERFNKLDIRLESMQQN